MANLKSGEFQKSLAALQNMAKSQLHHTASDSNPGEWGEASQEVVDELHGSGVNISDNGTDYDGVRKAIANKIRKSQALTPAEVAVADQANPLPAIQAKLSKGLQLTPVEAWALNGGYNAATGQYLSKASTKPQEGAPMSGEDDDANSVPPTNAGGKEDEIEGNAKKSFNSAVGRSLELQKGLEISPFLYELTNAIGSALAGSEERVIKSLANTLGTLARRVEGLEKSLAAQDEYNSALAKAVVGIGEAVGTTAEATAQRAQLPVGAPKSQTFGGSYDNNNGINVMSKSYSGPGGLDMNMDKSLVSDALVELVKSNEILPVEVIRFESSNEILPATMKKVEAFVRSKN